MRLIRRDQRGPQVRDVQARLLELGYAEAGLDAESREAWFGEATEKAVRSFQEARRLRVDGLVGDQTWLELVEASYELGDRFLYITVPAFRGDDVREAQRFLNSLGFSAGKEDGIFGRETEAAVKAFQANTGLPQDGILGAATINALLSLRHAVKPTSIAEVREKLSVESVSRLEEIQVLVAGPPAGNAGELVNRLQGVLKERGAGVTEATWLAEADESRVAAEANRICADLLFGLCPAAAEETPRDNLVLYYFSGGKSESPEGKRLALLMAEELGPHAHQPIAVVGKSFRILRESRMPCVVLEGEVREAQLESAAGALQAAIVRWLGL